MNIAIAITGASGTIYGRQLLESLASISGVNLSVIFSSYGLQVAKWEGEYERIMAIKGIKFYDNGNICCSLASGSSQLDALVVVPCTASTLSRLAHGTSDSLITRCGDVMLKERRKVIICLRETPLSLIHINNMAAITSAGAIVMPLSPSFYSRPTTIEEVAATQTERILTLLSINSDRFIFQGEGE